MLPTTIRGEHFLVSWFPEAGHGKRLETRLFLHGQKTFILENFTGCFFDKAPESVYGIILCLKLRLNLRKFLHIFVMQPSQSEPSSTFICFERNVVD